MKRIDQVLQLLCKAGVTLHLQVPHSSQRDTISWPHTILIPFNLSAVSNKREFNKGFCLPNRQHTFANIFEGMKCVPKIHQNDF